MESWSLFRIISVYKQDFFRRRYIEDRRGTNLRTQYIIDRGLLSILLDLVIFEELGLIVAETFYFFTKLYFKQTLSSVLWLREQLCLDAKVITNLDSLELYCV